MATRQPAQRRDDEPAFVLHAYPYRETSLIVEAFTPNFGRVAMVARGATRPRSEARELLQAVSGADLSNDLHPFGYSREIEIGYARVRASRITYVGELGWEV